MIIKNAEFVTSAVKPSQYPDADLPEIAFAGRSNVGKSSLINCLVNRRHLVKTSSTPGRTQLVNFFDINKLFSFVDLPGYGYAKVPAHIRKTWGPMIETYLSERKTLKGVVLLMDMRRKPGKEEQDLIEWLDYHKVPVVIVLTKADKFSKTKRKNQMKKLTEELGMDEENLIQFSSKTRLGKEKLWRVLEDLIEYKQINKNMEQK